MIGDPISAFDTHHPRRIDILRLYFHFPSSISESTKIAEIVEKIEDFYRSGDLRIKQTETIRLKIKRLVKSFKVIVSKRKIFRTSNAEKNRQEKFHEDIHGLFDILNYDAPNSSDSTDHEMTDNTNDSECSKFDGIQDVVDFGETTYHSGPEDSSNDPDSDPDYSPDDEIENSPKKKLPIPEDILKQISETKGSFRLCQDLLRLGVQISGSDPINYKLSKTSIWKQVIELRERQKKELHSFLRRSDCKIVIQFDGKKYTKLNERHVGNEERIIVLGHTMRGDIPLGLFIVETHSGADCAQAVFKSIETHNIQERIVGLVCDTESVNTGVENGACALIERRLGKLLPRLMCRHHIFEIILKAEFEFCFGLSTGPSVTTFDILKHEWNEIKRNQFLYQSYGHDETRHPIVKKLTDEAIGIISQQVDHFRNDYAELSDLVLKFLGVPTDSPFKVPSATSNARWMQRAIYALKCYMFREYLELETDFVEYLERFCLFVALTYTKYWNQCSNAADAPINDLQFLKELDLYRQFDAEIADAATVAFKRHLTYLSEELITLALFSDKVSNDHKSTMALHLALLTTTSHRARNSIKHTDEIHDIQSVEIYDFISARSNFLLNILGIDADFLSEDPSEWDEIQSYKHAKLTVKNLITVVNDSAERNLQFGAELIANQRIQTEERLQNFVVSASYKRYTNIVLFCYTFSQIFFFTDSLA